MDLITNNWMGCFGLQLISMTAVVSFKTIDLQELGSLVHLLNQKHIKKDVIENLNQVYKLEIPAFDPSDLHIMAANIEQRACRLEAQKFSDLSISKGHWHLGEKSFFFCVISFYAHLYRIPIEHMKEAEIVPLQRIFRSKLPKALLFEVKHLFNLHSKVEWLEEDAQILESLMNSQIGLQAKTGAYGIKWKQIAYELFMRSNTGEFYSARDCRNKWLSHLSPEITKDCWSVQEEIRLCQLVAQIGTKWSQISRKMGGVRTEHMVKNKINALMRTVFKKKFKVITHKHLLRILQVLRITADEKKSQIQQVTPNIESIEETKTYQQVEKIREDLSCEKTHIFDFQKPFSSSRLVMIPHDSGDSWEYNEDISFNDYNNYFSFN